MRPKTSKEGKLTKWTVFTNKDASFKRISLEDKTLSQRLDASLWTLLTDIVESTNLLLIDRQVY